MLRECEGQHSFAGVPSLGHRKAWGAGLAVPAFELRQIAACCLFKDLKPILNGRGISVMAFKVEIQCLGVGLIAHQSLKHADDLGALFIDCGGVEVVDLLKAFGPHWVCQWALVLRKLAAAQVDHVADAFDGGRAHV